MSNWQENIWAGAEQWVASWLALASQQEGCGFDQAFLCRVSMLCPCLCGFPPGALVPPLSKAYRPAWLNSGAAKAAAAWIDHPVHRFVAPAILHWQTKRLQWLCNKIHGCQRPSSNNDCHFIKCTFHEGFLKVLIQLDSLQKGIWN